MFIKKLTQNRGSALLIGLMVILMLTLVVVVSVNRSTTDIDLSYNKLHTEQALYVAEAGAESALGILNTDDTWRTGYTNKDCGEGAFSVRILDSLVDSTLADSLLIVSIGKVRQSKAQVELLCAPEYKRPFEYALFARDSIYLHKYACTDSYRSDSGSYSSTRLDSLGSVGSNNKIMTDAFASIGGDASVATGGNLDFSNKMYLYGDSTSTADTTVLDAVPDAEYDWAKTVNQATTGISGGIYTYDNGTNELHIQTGETIELQGGVYYFSDITFEQNANLVLAPGADVTIYVTGAIDLNQGSTMNDGGTPSDMLIFSKGPSLTFHQDNIFYGAFYGPDATVQYDQTTQVYGSLVGAQIDIDQNACLHYDRALYDLKRGKTGVVTAFAWKEGS